LRLKIFLAGRVAVETDRVVIDEQRFPGRQGRVLFAYLVAEQDRPVPRDELAEALWGDTLPATWEKALTVLVSKLRPLLTEGGLDGGTALTGAFGCYRLSLPETAWVDVNAAAAGIREAEAALADGDVEHAKVVALEASSLAQPQFLPGEDGSWVEEKRRELAAIRRRALNCLADACLQSGQETEAARWAEESLALDPFRETAYRRLMTAYAAAGDRAEALRVYDRCRRLLADELGAYPSPETESLFRELLAAAPSRNGGEAAPDPGARAPRRRGGAVATAVGALAIVGAVGAAVLATGGASSELPTLAANAVGLITSGSETVRQQIRIDAAPTGVVFGHGAVWVTNAYANTVSRIDPKTQSVRQTIAVGNSPSAIAVNERGLWVTNHADGTVSWINPDSNTVVGDIRVGHGPTAVATGYGYVWVANAGDRTVSRIDPRTGDVTTIQSGAAGRGIATGAGAVWVTDEASKGLVRIDPATQRVTNISPVGTGPAAIVYGDGALWVANELDGTVAEVDPTTLAVRATIPVGESPSALALTEDSLWVADEFGRRLVKIDTTTRAQRAALRVGNRPVALAPVPGGIWVATQASGVGHHGGRLVVIGDAFDTIDPGLSFSTDSFALLGLAYDGLTAFRRVGGSDGTQLVANLATTLPLPTDRGRSYTFTVRPRIRYSDGSLLRAEDFKRAFERMLVLGSPSLQNTPLMKVIGAETCRPGRRCDLSRGVLVQNDRSLTFRLSAPDARLPFALTQIVPVPRGTPARDIGTKPIPSTGPYTIESYIPRQRLTLLRNSRFRSWSQRARPSGYADEIVWRLDVPHADTVRLVEAGKADVLLSAVPASRVGDLAARYPRQLHLIPQRATAFAFLNTRRPPFDDVRVRRALNFAIDRRRLVELHGGAAVAQTTCQVIPPSVPGFRQHCPYANAWQAPDFTKAQALVAASGTRGQRVVVWTFPFFSGEGRYIVSVLRRLGYAAVLHEITRIDAYFQTIADTPTVQIGLAGWFGLQSASDALTTLTCDFEANWARFCDRRFDRDVRRLIAAQAADPAAGTALAARLDREIVAQAPWVPLFTPRLADFTSRRVGNYQANTYAAPSVLLDQLWVR
jgi:YVTN family beta-propeller protein